MKPLEPLRLPDPQDFDWWAVAGSLFGLYLKKFLQAADGYAVGSGKAR